MKVINYSAVARFIRNDVENIAGNIVDPNTIVTAIMRFSNEVHSHEEMEQRSFFRGVRLSLETGVVLVNVYLGQMEHPRVMAKLSELQMNGYIIKIHQFSASIRIVTFADQLPDILEVLSGIQYDVNERFAELKINMRGDDRRIDRIALLTDLLFRNGVHLINAFYTQSEISLIIREEDSSKAIEVIRNQVSRAIR
jgi:aspartokinase